MKSIMDEMEQEQTEEQAKQEIARRWGLDDGVVKDMHDRQGYPYTTILSVLNSFD